MREQCLRIYGVEDKRTEGEGRKEGRKVVVEEEEEEEEEEMFAWKKINKSVSKSINYVCTALSIL